MGQDKAFLPFHGVPLIEYIVNRGKILTNDLLVCANQAEPYQFLQLPVIADQLAQRGALVGMHTALSAAARPLVAVIGCDMPFFSPWLLGYQAQLLEESLLEESQVDAVVPRSRNGLEPLHGVYRRAPCLEAINQALGKNIQSLNGWLGLMNVLEITEDQIRPFDPESHIFTNLNTPGEYQRAAGLSSPFDGG